MERIESAGKRAARQAALGASAAMWALWVWSTPAAAQGQQIEGSLKQMVDWLSGLMVVLGALGLLIAIIYKLFAWGEKSSQRANSAIMGSIVAIAAGFAVPAIVGLLQQFFQA